MRTPNKPRESLKRRKPGLMRLEQRLMFDGAAVGTAVDVVDTADVADASALTESVFAPHATAITANPGRQEIAFVDAGIEGYEALVDAIDPAIETVVVDADADGLQVLLATLVEHSDVDAVHLLGHGSEGSQRLGIATLEAETLDGLAVQLAEMGQQLSDDADILLYGCYVGDGSGALFVNELATLTGADVAASTDKTGNDAAGGDWELEHRAGLIETEALFESVDGFDGTLVAPTVENPGDQTITEDATYAFGDVNVTSPDSDFMEAVATLTAGDGVLRGPGNVEFSQLASQGDRAATNAFLDALEFVPTANWNGTATVTIAIETNYTDADATDVTTITINITVQSVNDAPTAAGGTININEDTPHAFDVADFGFADTADDPADALVDAVIDTLPVSGVLSLSDTPIIAGATIAVADIPKPEIHAGLQCQRCRARELHVPVTG
jgi:hypothetical protein